MEPQWEAEGKTVLITGGASGLGAGKVEALLKAGAKAITIFDVSENGTRELISRCKPYSDRVTFIKCDVSNEEDLTRAFNQVLESYKKLDLIINCAGILDDSPAGWSKECDINLKALISLTWKGVDHMSKAKGGAGGTIVNVSSVGALYRVRNFPVYCATKIGVLHFSRCLSSGDFYEHTNVRILTICYALTDTPIIAGITQRAYDEQRGKIFADNLKEMHVQKIESAVKAFMVMVSKGSNGSVWYSGYDKPAKDITPAMDQVIDILKEATEHEIIEN